MSSSSYEGHSTPSFFQAQKHQAQDRDRRFSDVMTCGRCTMEKTEKVVIQSYYYAGWNSVLRMLEPLLFEMGSMESRALLESSPLWMWWQ